MTRRYSIRYGRWRLLLSALGLGPRFSYISVEPSAIRVAMGWAFSGVIPRAQIENVRRGQPGAKLLGVGVHGWAGRWLVNGSTRDIVELNTSTVLRARVCGVPMRLRTLWVSVEEPDRFVSELQSTA